MLSERSSNKNGHCDVAWLSSRRTRQNGALFTAHKESILAISQGTASVSVVHESFAITGAFEESLDMVNGPKVASDFTFCTPDLELAHVHFQYRAWFFMLACLAEAGGVFLAEMFFPGSLSSGVAWNARCGRVASLLVLQYLGMFRPMDESDSSMKVSFQAYSSYTSLQ